MSKQEVKLASVRKSCRIAKKIAGIIAWFTGICGGLCVAGAGIVMALQNKINPVLAMRPEDFSITNPQIRGIISLHIDLQRLLLEGEYAQATAIVCIFGAVMCIVTAAILALIARALVKMEKSETPFNEEVLGLLKKAFIGLTIVTGLFSGVGPALVVGLSLWCVYCIMDYGCVLQEEVDETI